MDRLEEQPLPHLTLNEHESLVVLIQTVLEVSVQLTHVIDYSSTIFLGRTAAPCIRRERLAICHINAHLPQLQSQVIHVNPKLVGYENSHSNATARTSALSRHHLGLS